MTARPLRIALVVLLFGALVGCEKRRIKKELEDASDVKAALADMKKADGKVLEAREALEASKGADTDALVEVIHDYSVALQGTVKPGLALAAALDHFAPASKDDLVRVCECGGVIVLDAQALKKNCGHELTLDEIDTCGGTWGRMVKSANEFADAAKKFDVDLPQVR